MARNTLIALLALSLTACGVGAPGEQAATLLFVANTCGNASTAPQLFSRLTVSPPALGTNGSAPSGWNPTNGRLSLGGIEYLAGDGVRIDLETDSCTHIGSVQLGSHTLTRNTPDTYWYNEAGTTTQPTDPTHYGITLWAFFPNPRDGSTDTLAVTLARTGGGGTTSFNMPIVHAKSIGANNTTLPVGISAAEMSNMFAKSLFAKFGPNNSFTTTIDHLTAEIHGYDPARLSVSIDANGIYFWFPFYVTIPALDCTGSAHAFGQFQLVPIGGTLTPKWSTSLPATINVDWGSCVAEYLTFGQVLPDYSDGSMVASAILSSLQDIDATFVASASTVNNELRLQIAPPTGPNVEIEVPYDAFDMNRSATLIPPGENVWLFASGLGVNDTAAGINRAIWIGPNGIPRAGTTLYPGALTLARSSLPWMSQPVARLLMRQQTSWSPLPQPLAAYAPGCGLTAASATCQMRFGVNDDATDAQRLRGTTGAAPGYSLRLQFTIAAPPACELDGPVYAPN